MKISRNNFLTKYEVSMIFSTSKSCFWTHFPKSKLSGILEVIFPPWQELNIIREILILIIALYSYQKL